MSCGCDKNNRALAAQHEGDWCVECEVPQLARNHYFDMKLMVARDFTDEQRYFVGKDRRHNQRLHGWGTVCGLRVVPHPNQACRQQYVVIQPGTAVDCCGREVVVEREQTYDFRAAFLDWWKAGHPAPQGVVQAPDPAEEHALQICLRYRECATEDVPVLFDDCSCDAGACQPNRILESFELGLLVDAPQQTPSPEGVRLRWTATKEIANARWIAQDSAGHKLYVLSADDPALLYVYDTAGALNQSNLAPASNPVQVGAKALDVAIAPDGKWLYLALVNASGKADIVAYDTGDLSAARKNVAAGVEDIAGGLHILAARGTAASGRLFALRPGAANAQLLAWDDPAGTPAGVNGGAPLNVAAGPVGMGVASDGLDDWLIVACASQVSAAKAGDLSAIASHNYGVAGLAPSAMALAKTTDPIRLFVADATAKTVSVFELRPGTATPLESKGTSPALPAAPADIVATAGGRWVFALAADAAGKSSVQAIDAHAVETNEPGKALGPSEAIGDQPQRLLLAGSGARLYASFAGAPGAGGLAVMDVEEDNCEEIFLSALDGCPVCPDQECLVLATIAGYHYDDAVDEEDIDNVSDRQLLPSTQLIAEAVKCLMSERATAVQGEQGPPGPPGKDGQGIDDVQVAFVPCENGVHGTSSAELKVIGGKRTLVLQIAEGCDGQDGAPGIEDIAVTFLPCVNGQHGTSSASVQVINGKRTLVLQIAEGCDGTSGGPVRLALPRIVAVNWPHNGVIDAETAEGREALVRLDRQGLVIAFQRERPVFAETFVGPLSPMPQPDPRRLMAEQSKVVQVLMQADPRQASGYLAFTRVNLVGVVSGTDVEANCDFMHEPSDEDRFQGPVTAARFRPVNPEGFPSDRWFDGHYMVFVEGDFILGVDTIKIPDPDDPQGELEVHPALDANHLGPGLIGKGNTTSFGVGQRCPTGDTVEGGRFVSWFSIVNAG